MNFEDFESSDSELDFELRYYILYIIYIYIIILYWILYSLIIAIPVQINQGCMLEIVFIGIIHERI